jgi:hypothetical protein
MTTQNVQANNEAKKVQRIIFTDCGINNGEYRAYGWANSASETYVAAEDYDALQDQLASFLKATGAEIKDGELCLSSAGYGAWSKRKGGQRTQEIVVENESLKAQLQAYAGNDNSILTRHILMKWDREKIERFALHLLGDEWQEKVATARKYAFEEFKEIARQQAETIQNTIDEPDLPHGNRLYYRSYPAGITAISEAIEAANKEQ